MAECVGILKNRLFSKLNNECSYNYVFRLTMSRVGNFLSGIFANGRIEQQINTQPNLSEISNTYEHFAPYSLGTYHHSDIAKRDRKEIYTMYKRMQQDPTIDAALNLLVTAALGGHETRGEVVFISAADHLRSDGTRSKQLKTLIDKEKKYLQNLINNFIFALVRNGITFGDSYARIYGSHGYGITHVCCDEYVEPPLIQAYERAGKTVGYHVLEQNQYEIKGITKLTTAQMIRMKMQRIVPVPQFRLDHVLHGRILQTNEIDQVPIIPSPVGGSFLQNVEDAWTQTQLMFAALNSQQIADSVKNMFMTIDVSNMPPENRKIYKESLIKALLQQHEKTKDALKGGDPIWGTNVVVLPQWGEKQVVNPLGDIAQRTAPLSMELVLTHLRRAMGSLGLDISLVGWADMLAGGLGDGAAFHTSAQVMQRSALIRQAVTEPLIDLILLHFAYKTGNLFSRDDLPFKIEFYSDISAAASEALNNKNTRSNTLMLTAQSLLALKELNLGDQSSKLLLTEYLGMDDDQAEIVCIDLKAAKKEELAAQAAAQNPDGFTPPEESETDLEDEDV